MTDRDTQDDVSTVSSGKKPIFAIFEGGGAKGIAHVGAYAAAEALGFELVGVAGASAGAIVAALIAVGFKPKVIFNPDQPGENIFSHHEISAIAALGAPEWRQFQRLRRYWLNVWIPIVASFVGAIAFRVAGWLLTADYLWLCFIALVVATVWRGFRLWNQRGIFDPGHFARVFNDVLHRRIVAAYAEVGQSVEKIPTKIRFRDIDPQVVSRFCRLKIVATDISGQQLRLFDHRTPDVVVAEAVAASIAIPGLFKPASIPSFTDGERDARSRYYADGGLVSNLPVWCFSEEKAAAERRQVNSAAIPVVAFSLSNATLGSRPQVLRPLRYFLQVMQSAIFGGQTVVQEFVQDLYSIPLACTLSVLAFDATWEQARAAYRQALQNAGARLRQRLILEPAEWASVLSTACAEIQRILLQHLRAYDAELRLRAAVFEPNRPSRRQVPDTMITAFKVTHSFNMEKDTDDRLTLDAKCPGVPEAYEQRQAVLWSPSATAVRLPVMTKYERALARRTVKSVICIPIFSSVSEWNVEPGSRNQPLAVVALDTDEDIIQGLGSDSIALKAVIEATSGISAVLTERQ